jgi:hypothetical protein
VVDAASKRAETLDVAEVYAMIDSLGDVGATLAEAKPTAPNRLYRELNVNAIYLPEERAVDVPAGPRVDIARVRGGLGHGIVEWMEQVGARVASPMTLLREFAVAVRDLLDGLPALEVPVEVRTNTLRRQIRTAFAGLNAFPIMVEARRAQLLAGIRSALASGNVRFRVESITRGATRPHPSRRQRRWAVQARRDHEHPQIRTRIRDAPVAAGPFMVEIDADTHRRAEGVGMARETEAWRPAPPGGALDRRGQG